MWLPSREALIDARTNQSSLFVAQAWRELTDPQSPDTYRGRTLDSILLLDELERVLRLAKSDNKWLSHVHAICEEIGEDKAGFLKLNFDSAAKRAFATLGELRTSKYDDLCRVEEAVGIAKSLSRNYVSVLQNQARALLHDDIHEKQGLLRALSCLATHAQGLGFSDEINRTLDSYDLADAPEGIVDVIAARFSEPDKPYKCFVGIRGSIPELDAFPELDALFSETDLVRIGLPRIERLAVGRAWHSSHAACYLVEVPCLAVSRRSAAESALARLKATLDMLVLYENGQSHQLSHTILVEANDGTLEEINVSPAAYFGLFPRKEYVRTARSRITRLGPRLDGQVADILGAHSLGVSASDPRAAIIHFWTALETIVSGYGSGSIGERVANAISPVITGRRIHKIATYLALSLYDLAKLIGERPDPSLMPASTKGRVASEDVLCCLTGASDNPGMHELFRLSDRSPLLRYHLSRAWGELHDPRELHKSLKQSEQRVRWQLLRIYRARNVFVHMGGRDELMWRLLENAQSYVSFVVGRLMFDMDTHDTWTVRTSLEYQRQHRERVGEALKSSPETLRVSDLVPHLSPKAIDVPLWGGDSRFGER